MSSCTRWASLLFLFYIPAHPPPCSPLFSPVRLYNLNTTYSKIIKTQHLLMVRLTGVPREQLFLFSILYESNQDLVLSLLLSYEHCLQAVLLLLHLTRSIMKARITLSRCWAAWAGLFICGNFQFPFPLFKFLSFKSILADFFVR